MIETISIIVAVVLGALFLGLFAEAAWLFWGPRR